MRLEYFLACVFLVSINGSSPAWDLAIKRLLQQKASRAAPTASESDSDDSQQKRRRLEEERLEWSTWVSHIRSNRSVPNDSLASQIRWDPSLPARFKALVVEQIKADLDHSEFAPDLSNPMLMTEETSMGLFVTGQEAVACTMTSCILRVEGRPTLVMKYQTDSPLDQQVIHPLLLDFWFLKAVEHLGISPRPYVVSPPSLLPERKGMKTRFHLHPIEWRGSVHEGAMVRYSIMERGGQSLHSYMRSQPEGRVAFRDAIQIGIKLLTLVRRLHEEGGIVHGDLHTGNFVKSPSSPEQFLIIDYGTATYIADYPDNVQVREPRSWINGMFTPWEIEGFRPGRRDDVFKVILAVAWIMNGQPLMDHLISLEDDVEASVEVKAVGDMFSALPGYDPLQDLAVPFRIRHKIKGKLANVLRIARSVESVSVRPDYEGLISEMESILSFV